MGPNQAPLLIGTVHRHVTNVAFDSAQHDANLPACVHLIRTSQVTPHKIRDC
jgi:hypothetical protein